MNKVAWLVVLTLGEGGYASLLQVAQQGRYAQEQQQRSNSSTG